MKYDCLLPDDCSFIINDSYIRPKPWTSFFIGLYTQSSDIHKECTWDKISLRLVSK